MPFQNPPRADVFVRDYSARSFVGTSFYIGPRRVIYDQEFLDRNVLPKIRGVFYDHRFSPVDPMKVLKLVNGNGREYSMQWKGPVYCPPAGGFPSNYDYPGLFLMADRGLLCWPLRTVREVKKAVDAARAQLLKADGSVKEGCRQRYTMLYSVLYTMLYTMLYNIVIRRSRKPRRS